MRQLNQNKQKLYYANFCGQVPVYAYDGDGNIITQVIDGETVEVIDSYKQGYTDATEFKANISFNSGDTQMAEYGLNVDSYNAVISADKGKLPFNEQTLIWFESTPQYDVEKHILPESADYRVVAIKTSLNEERFILKKRAEDGENIIPSA